MPTKEELFADAPSLVLRELESFSENVAERFNINTKVVYLNPGENLPAIEGMDIKCHQSVTNEEDPFPKMSAVDALPADQDRVVLLAETVDEEGEVQSSAHALSLQDFRHVSGHFIIDNQSVGRISTHPEFCLDRVSGCWHHVLRSYDIQDDELEGRRAEYQAILDILKAIAQNHPSEGAERDRFNMTIATLLDPENTAEAGHQHRNEAYDRWERSRVNPDRSDDLRALISASDFSMSAGMFDTNCTRWSRVGHHAFDHGVRVVGRKVFGNDFNVDMENVQMTSIPEAIRERFLETLNEERHVGRAKIEFDEIPGYEPIVNVYQAQLGTGDNTMSCAMLHVIDHSGHYAYAWPSENVELREELRAEEQVALPAPAAAIEDAREEQNDPDI